MSYTIVSYNGMLHYNIVLGYIDTLSQALGARRDGADVGSTRARVRWGQGSGEYYVLCYVIVYYSA